MTQVELADGTRRRMTAAEKAIADFGSHPVQGHSRSTTSTSPRITRSEDRLLPRDVRGQRVPANAPGEWKTNQGGNDETWRRSSAAGYGRLAADTSASSTTFPCFRLVECLGGYRQRAEPHRSKVYVVQTNTKVS